MRFTFHYPAPDHTVFSPWLPETMKGKKFLAKIEGVTVGEGTVVSAEVLNLGRAMNITVDWPEESHEAR